MWRGEPSTFQSWITNEEFACPLCRLSYCFPSACTGPEGVDAPGCLLGAGDVPVSPGPLEWGVSGTSVGSLCSAALLEVLVLVGSSGACSKVLATPRTPCFPSSFSTSMNKTHTKNQQPSVMVSVWYAGVFRLFLPLE